VGPIFVVRASPIMVIINAIAASMTRVQMPMVNHGCREHRRASDLGEILCNIVVAQFNSYMTDGIRVSWAI